MLLLSLFHYGFILVSFLFYREFIPFSLQFYRDCSSPVRYDFIAIVLLRLVTVLSRLFFPASLRYFIAGSRRFVLQPLSSLFHSCAPSTVNPPSVEMKVPNIETSARDLCSLSSTDFQDDAKTCPSYCNESGKHYNSVSCTKDGEFCCNYGSYLACCSNSSLEIDDSVDDNYNCSDILTS